MLGELVRDHLSPGSVFSIGDGVVVFSFLGEEEFAHHALAACVFGVYMGYDTVNGLVAVVEESGYIGVNGGCGGSFYFGDGGVSEDIRDGLDVVVFVCDYFVFFI